ncbi:MAG: aspartyl protease family protein [Flavobacteriaceae bacterium]|nr:aspartyl protease family protein [Flavobacteriaceae bacterium]
MRILRIYLFLFFLLFSFLGITQGKFRIVDTNKESVSIPFTLVNNLIVITGEVNGKELSFLLDTGITKTLLFNLKFSDSLKLNHIENIKLRGLGEGKSINALKSNKNTMRIKGIVNFNHRVYLIMDSMFDLSAKMGMDINGIIGGDLFKDFIVKIDYSKKKLTFYNPETYVNKGCKKCESFPLSFFNNKPFIDVYVENYLGQEHKANLLIDSGGGDALWLFEDTHPKIIVSKKYFRDYLGKGLNGDIYGKRSKVNKLRIGSFVFENASVSYPDSISILTVRNNQTRNGTLGAEMLKRFHVIFDYPNKKITLKKNLKYYKAPFLYNKSGIEIIYGGDMLVKERIPNFTNYKINDDGSNIITKMISSYGLAYKPSYEISNIRDGSPAKLAGLMVGDVILEINSSLAYDKEMQEIVLILSGKENKKIRLLVNRNGLHLKFEFYLKDML